MTLAEPNEFLAVLYAGLAAGARKAVEDSDVRDLPAEHVSVRAWNRSRWAIAPEHGALPVGQQMLAHISRLTGRKASWRPTLEHALSRSQR